MSKSTSTITIPVDIVTLRRDGPCAPDRVIIGVNSTDDARTFAASAESYGTEPKYLAKAKASLRETVLLTLAAAKRRDENPERSVIGCADGTVIILDYHGSGWGYVTTGPTRKHASGCSFGGDIRHFRDALDRTRRDAAECYGGIAWEMAL